MSRRRSIVLSLCAALAAIPAASFAAGRTLSIEHPWSRPTPPSAPTAVGYLTIVNHARKPDRLTAVLSPAAAKVEVHSMSMTGGIMRMRPVTAGVPVTPGGTVTLGPDGMHLMFVGLKRPFRAGDRIPVTLVFDHAGRVHAALVVQTSGDMGAMRGMVMH